MCIRDRFMQHMTPKERREFEKGLIADITSGNKGAMNELYKTYVPRYTALYIYCLQTLMMFQMSFMIRCLMFGAKPTASKGARP